MAGDLESFEIPQDRRVISVEAFHLGADKLIAVAFDGVEELSTLSRFRIEVVTKGRQLTPDEVLGQNLTIKLRTRSIERAFNGIVSRFEVLRSGFRGHFLHLFEVVPPAWLLTLNQRCRIFTDTKSHDVISQVLQESGINAQLKSVGAQREYWVQYCESDFNFIARLLEEEGLYYRFDHSASECTLIVGDGASDYVRAEPETLVLFDTLVSWQPQYRIGAKSFKHTAWDYKAVANMDAQANGVPASQPPGVSGREVYEFPGRHETNDEGDSYATRRMAEQEAQAVQIPASSEHILIEAGRKFKIKDGSIALPNGSPSGEFLVVKVEHRARDTTEMPFEGGVSYVNDFIAIPAQFDYRPPRVTPRPYIRGPQTAVVVDTPDDMGRAKVKFHWDDDDASRWVRVAQVWAYNKMGTQFFPRIDSEVVVEFLDGDPDHPIIVGQVYNGKNVPPFDVPGNKTQSGFRGANWGDAGTPDVSNELRFEDKEGSEEIYINAQKDMRRVVQNDDTLTVTQGNRTKEIKQGNVTETLDMGNHTTELKMGDHALKVDLGKTTSDAMQSITLTVGQSSITIDQMGVTIKGMMISIQGTVQAEMKAVLTTVNADAILTLKGGLTMIN